MDTHEHDASPNDFLDVLRSGFFFVKEGYLFLKAAFIKKFLVILIFCIAGLLIGYFKHHISKPIYKGTMQVTQSDVSKEIFIKKLQALNELVETHSYHSLAKKLSISTAAATEICHISAVSLNKDSISISSFLIKVELTDYTIADTLQAGLLNYLNHFEYLNKLKKIQRVLHSEKIAFIDRQLAQLDTFKIMYSKSMSHVNTGSVNLMLNQNDMSDLFKQSVELLQQRQMLVEILQAHEEVVYLLDDLSVSEKPNSGGLLSDMVKGFLLGFLVGYLIAVFSLLNDRFVVKPRAN